ncbi:hypothetical protein PTI45_03800 [Paenibacillus nuruki]|uniref:Restriction endonuclease type IV Mrr domain-containing protein n=1 Tax=Paenibacillus nuruki TaxID=1886670 RepID=A0A1E3KZ70_9BACL|nr:hypothetical protein [Paenibacillus nuruki]ODP26839.1 hypothetical protein PTI45_03800 [Paenibacillus nuruki]
MIVIVTLSNIKASILEDVLAKLLENSGYTLITKATIENKQLYPEFCTRGNGLNILGRGGIHQADALGQFPITIPFNYPVRLFLEAKYFKKSKKVGIDVVRSAVGILADLNTSYQTVQLEGEDLLVQRYTYKFAIFSVSGFSLDAIRLAVANQITMIDLSGSEFSTLIQAIDNISVAIEKNLKNTPSVTWSKIRSRLQEKLFSATSKDMETESNSLIESEFVESFISFIEGYGDLYLAAVDSPFSILLKPTNPEHFKHFLMDHPKSTFSVKIK